MTEATRGSAATSAMISSVASTTIRSAVQPQRSGVATRRSRLAPNVSPTTSPATPSTAPTKEERTGTGRRRPPFDRAKELPARAHPTATARTAGRSLPPLPSRRGPRPRPARRSPPRGRAPRARPPQPRSPGRARPAATRHGARARRLPQEAPPRPRRGPRPAPRSLRRALRRSRNDPGQRALGPRHAECALDDLVRGRGGVVAGECLAQREQPGERRHQDATDIRRRGPVPTSAPPRCRPGDRWRRAVRTPRRRVTPQATRRGGPPPARRRRSPPRRRGGRLRPRAGGR